MANVKQARLLPGPLVAFTHTEIAVLDGHRVATERHHFPATNDVQFMEVRSAQFAIRLCCIRLRIIGTFAGAVAGALGVPAGDDVCGPRKKRLSSALPLEPDVLSGIWNGWRDGMQ